MEGTLIDDRLEAIQKALKQVERQMPDRLKKHPGREERTGHKWFKPSFEEEAIKYFKKKSISSMTLGKLASQPRPISTILEFALDGLRQSGEPGVPPLDKNKLLMKLEARAQGGKKKEEGGKEKKKKGKK